MKKTPVELLFDALWTAPKDKFVWQSILKQAKEVEKQEIMIAYDCGADNQYNCEQYTETYKDVSPEDYYKESYEL